MTDLRLAIGPANFAGQATAWAEAVTKHTPAEARSFAYGRRLGGGIDTGTFGFSADTFLPHPRVPYLPLRAFWLRRALTSSTHLALDGHLSLRGSNVLAGLARDIPLLQRRGFRIALISHGSDIRDPDRHMAQVANSYYSSAPDSWVSALRDQSRENRAVAINSGLPLFVSTPDLLDDLPDAQWLPLTVSEDSFQPEKIKTDGPLRVLHIPSRTDPPIKGSKFIIPVLEELHEDGEIIWLRGSNVPHQEMLAMMYEADVVIDQIGTGSYGLTTVEAMAARAAVVGKIDPGTLSKMPERPPIVPADPTTLREVIRELASDRDFTRHQGVQGASFARRWHDGHKSAAVLARFLGVNTNLTNGASGVVPDDAV